MSDTNNIEYLVYETYQMLADTSLVVLNNSAYESALLDNVNPKSLNLYIHNASLRLDSIHYNDRDRVYQYGMKISRFLKEQSEEIVKKLNNNLEKRGALWRAGITSMSDKTYEDKKAMFGSKMPELYGFEYYKGGIFVMPEVEKNVKKIEVQRDRTTSLYVKEWDWRNRHGKNWMTPVTFQGTCNSCWAFSSIGTFEAYINLYYNQLLNYDLSEQEIVSCSSAGNCQVGGTLLGALNYIYSSGVVPDSCFTYAASDISCDEKCNNPDDILSIEDFSHTNTTDEDSIKRMLFKSPICFGIYPWWHFAVLAGFKQIESGEYYFTVEDHTHKVPIPQSSPLVGHAAWLIKNSAGTSWGDQGYGYVAMSLSDAYGIFKLYGAVYSQKLSESNIVCSDDDGDGLYFWGVGSKPAHCPSWVPNTPDGDDSNINYGSLDSYGNLETLPPGITIKTPVTYSSNSSTSYRLGIVNGGSLTITGVTTLTGESKIRVCEGGILIVDGGTIQNADITMVPGSKLIIRNNGVVNMAAGKKFEAPIGVVVNVENGRIN